MIDANEILPGLWVGSFPAPEDFYASGFNAIVVVARERITSDLPTMFPLARIVTAGLEDKPIDQPTIQTSINAARAAAGLVKEGRKVLIACNMGVNRSALVSAMTLHILRGVSGAEAVQAIRRARRGTLVNKSFVEYLLRVPRRAA